MRDRLAAQLKKNISNNNPSAPVLEIEYADEPSSPLRAHDTSHSSNWIVPANTNGSRKAQNVFSGSSIHYASSNGISNSPIRFVYCCFLWLWSVSLFLYRTLLGNYKLTIKNCRTSAGVQVHGSPIRSPARLPVFHARLVA